MSSSADDGRAIDYIIENRQKYPRAQIDAELVESGHPSTAIEDYWVGIEQGYAEVAAERNAGRELLKQQASTPEISP